MILKTPSFWYRAPDVSAPFIEYALLPLSWLYAAGRWVHCAFKMPQHVDIPVICVGNITTGGAGKTPVALALMKVIKDQGLFKNPVFLTRGYGGQLHGPTLVKELHNYQHVGDEALLLSALAPTVVAKNRLAGARYACDQGAGVIIMDDGLQNPSLHKDFKIIVIGGALGFGNKKCLPAGPLRESLTTGLSCADMFVITGSDVCNIENDLPGDVPKMKTEFHVDPRAIPDKTKLYVAFSGLGYPQKFFNFLQDDLGLNVVETIPYPDHHPYTAADIKFLQNAAKGHEAVLITTEKDMVRIPGAFKGGIKALPVELRWEDEDTLISHLKGLRV